jgi:hypothetical protein
LNLPAVGIANAKLFYDFCWKSRMVCFFCQVVYATLGFTEPVDLSLDNSGIDSTYVYTFLNRPAQSIHCRKFRRKQIKARRRSSVGDAKTPAKACHSLRGALAGS